MAPLKIALVGVLGIGIAASLAFADHKPNHPGGGGAITGVWVFAGYSTTLLVPGDATLPGMYASCQIDFGDNARMALTTEWVKSPNIMVPGADAWIHPVTGAPQSSDGTPYPDIFYNDHTGNCDGWTDTTGQGVAIFSEGFIGRRACDVSRPVACVVPQ